MTTHVPATRIDDIRALGVEVALPGDDGWDAARLAWHVTFDQRPAAVARPRSAEEVAAVVRFANSAGMRVSGQGTGHNAPPLGNLDDTILIRTDHMRAVTIDAASRTARAGAGALWEDVVVPAAAEGLSALHGSSPDVGVVGYVLGGGVGWQVRKRGLATNSVLAFELVTADGEVIRADAATEPDLFWALRGGGGNFGIVTAVELELFPMEHLSAGWLIFPWERSADVLHAWREWTLTVPEDVTSVGRILRLPPLEMIPEPLRGRDIVVVEAAITAPPEEADALMAPLRALGPEMDTFGPAGILDLVRLHQDPEGPTPAHVKHELLDDLTPEGLDAFIRELGPGSDSPLVSAEIRHLGGAAGRPHPGGGAMSHLRAGYAYLGVGMVMSPEMGEAVKARLERVHRTFGRFSNGNEYLNFVEDRTDTRRAFTADAHERLVRVRRRFDPVNRVKANHLLTPA